MFARLVGRTASVAGVATPEYVFTHTTEVAADPARVHALLLDLEHYVDWWPQVRAVASLGPEDALVVCRSVLPYDLELLLHASSRDPELLEVEIDGPIRGFARWRLVPMQVGEHNGTRLEFEQRVHAVKRMFVLASYVGKPVLAWNHHRMMQGAERGLAAALST